MKADGTARMIGPLLVRADASEAMGGGHVLRQLALAQAWRRYGQVTLASRVLHPAVGDRWLAEGFEVVQLASDSPDELGRLAARRQVAWLAIDGYHLSPSLQDQPDGINVLMVDDFGTVGDYRCQLLVDQNLGARPEQYPGLPDVLLGPSYALLREEFVRDGASRIDRISRRAVQRIVLTLGALPRREFVDDLLARLTAALATVDIQTPTRAGAKLRDMAGLLADCDLAVSAAGSSVWELCYLGIPSVVFPVADNQREVARRLDQAGLAVCVEGDPADPAAIVSAVVQLVGDPTKRSALAAAARGVVDGRGARRVAAVMASRAIRARPATEADSRQLWEWANDPVARANSFSPEPIAWADHVRWFAGRLQSSCIYVMELGGAAPLGYVRFDPTTHAGLFEISISIDASLRGRGLAAPVIVAASRALRATAPGVSIEAQVKAHNRASIDAFLTAGFVPAGGDSRTESIVRFLSEADS